MKADIETLIQECMNKKQRKTDMYQDVFSFNEIKS